jgi:hypothetical protein
MNYLLNFISDFENLFFLKKHITLYSTVKIFLQLIFLFVIKWLQCSYACTSDSSRLNFFCFIFFLFFIFCEAFPYPSNSSHCQIGNFLGKSQSLSFAQVLHNPFFFIFTPFLIFILLLSLRIRRFEF